MKQLNASFHLSKEIYDWVMSYIEECVFDKATEAKPKETEDLDTYLIKRSRSHDT